MSGGYSVAVCGLLIAVVLLLWSMGSRSTGSVVVACGLSSCGLRALERRLSSCGARAYLLCGMWDLPGPGLEPVSPALTGGFLTTVPPGKTLLYIIYLLVFVFQYGVFLLFLMKRISIKGFMGLYIKEMFHFFISHTEREKEREREKESIKEKNKI